MLIYYVGPMPAMSVSKFVSHWLPDKYLSFAHLAVSLEHTLVSLTFGTDSVLPGEIRL